MEVDDLTNIIHAAHRFRPQQLPLPLAEQPRSPSEWRRDPFASPEGEAAWKRARDLQDQEERDLAPQVPTEFPPFD